MSDGQMSNGQMTDGQMSDGQMSNGPMVFDQKTWNIPSFFDEVKNWKLSFWSEDQGEKNI